MSSSSDLSKSNEEEHSTKYKWLKFKKIIDEVNVDNMTLDLILKYFSNGNDFPWTNDVSGITLALCFRMQYMMNLTDLSTKNSKTVVRPPAMPNSVVTI